MTHTMNLKPEPFSQIACGAKTIELRLYDEKRQKIAVGDTLIFSSSEDMGKKLYCKVKALHIFESFAELYRALPLEKCGYLPHELPFASPSDMNIYYPEEKQREFGVVGIELELNDKDSD